MSPQSIDVEHVTPNLTTNTEYMDIKGTPNHNRSPITILEEEFLSDIASRRYSPKSIHLYRMALANFERFLTTVGIGCVQEVTKDVILAYRRHLQELRFSSGKAHAGL